MRTIFCKHSWAEMAGMKMNVHTQCVVLKPSGVDLDVKVLDLSKESKKVAWTLGPRYLLQLDSNKKVTI